MYLYVQYELLVSTNRCIFLSIIIPSLLPVLSGMAIKLSELRHLSVRSQEQLVVRSYEGLLHKP